MVHVSKVFELLGLQVELTHRPWPQAWELGLADQTDLTNLTDPTDPTNLAGSADPTDPTDPTHPTHQNLEDMAISNAKR